MIDINELRIGNLVSTNGKPMNTSDKGVYKVLAIDSRDSFEELKGCVTITCDDPRYRDIGAWCQYLEPIPLTPELLEKYGFIYDKEIGYFVNNSLRISIKVGFFGTSKIGIYYLHFFLIFCKYLHQLQNMYYAITGKELEINT